MKKMLRLKDRDTDLPILIDPDFISVIRCHHVSDMGVHDGCGTLYLKGGSNTDFHIADAEKAIQMVEEYLNSPTEQAKEGGEK